MKALCAAWYSDLDMGIVLVYLRGLPTLRRSYPYIVCLN